jgi:serine/threonine protein kinase
LSADLTRNEALVALFQHEARAASSLNHPNILTIHEIGKVDDRQFIATEFIEGETLRQKIRRDKLDLREVLDIAVQVAGALAAAHAAGIVHKDIKPENIMVRPDGYVKVLDFGLAELVGPRTNTNQSESRIDRAMPVRGTVRYMSPEQVRGLAVDPRTDIFSLGVVLFEMIAGRVPFEGETTTDRIAALLNQEPPPLLQYAPNTPAVLQDIVHKALRKNTDERYQTSAEFLADLNSLKQELDLRVSDHGSAATRTVTRTIGWLAIAMLVVVTVTYVANKLANKSQAPFQTIRIARIPDTEKSVQVAISPDGKYIAHVKWGVRQQSLWVVDIATNSSVQIARPANVEYGGLTFSKDGSYIFYAHNDDVLYQIPVSGGEARKVLVDVASPISFSPDGKRFAFARELNSEESALMIANLDGGEERILAKRKKPEYISTDGPSWSPDGSLIACGFGLIAGNRDMSVVGIEVATGQEKQITAQKWQEVDRVAWLSDGSGLVTSALETGSGPHQIWYIPYSGGEPRRVTSDLNNYGEISLTADSKNLVAIQFEQRNSLWIVPDGDPSRARPLTSSKHEAYRVISWTPDSRILYASSASGNRDIWIMSADGTNQKQLTASAGLNLQPMASHDGRYIVFLSNRAKTSAFNIWRMDIDGSNPIQLTHGSGEVQPICSPDGYWVVYSQTGPEISAEKKTVWRVPIDGGEPVPLTNTPSDGPDISPDGRLIACWYKQDATSPWKIALVPLEGGPPTKILDATRTSIFRLRWTKDGQAITYIKTQDEVSNIWSQPITGGPPKQLTQFTSEVMEGFDWSSNGHLICSRGFNARDVVLISNF